MPPTEPALDLAEELLIHQELQATRRTETAAQLTAEIDVLLRARLTRHPAAPPTSPLDPD